MNEPNRRPRVLYVEDERLLHPVLELGLEEEGFEVLLAASGEEGIAVLEERLAEVVGLVTDINLGQGCDGCEVARQARARNPALPVIYVSGRDGHEWIVRGVPRSVLIAKPFAVAQIATALADLLDPGAATGT
ncbi:MAG: response regulator [Brevundimonas sp.]